jgi:putative DNA primase/helicase
MKESKISLKHQSFRLSGHFYITLPAILLGKPITFFFTENGTDPGCCGELWQERPTLVAAALTILRAYFVVGCPSQGIKPFGSFEEWSAIVRQALVWAGEVDPCDGRKDLEAESDPDYEALSTLLTTWYACYGTRSRTLKQVVADIRRHTQASLMSSEWDELQDALGNLDANYTGQGLNTRVIGEALRSWKGRLIDGKRFIKASTDRKGLVEWRIEVLHD